MNKSDHKVDPTRMELFFEHSLDLLCVMDFDGHFIKVNHQWQKALGWSKDEMEGKLAIEKVFEEDVNESILMFENSRNSEISNAEFRWYCNNGEILWLA